VAFVSVPSLSISAQRSTLVSKEGTSPGGRLCIHVWCKSAALIYAAGLKRGKDKRSSMLERAGDQNNSF